MVRHTPLAAIANFISPRPQPLTTIIPNRIEVSHLYNHYDERHHFESPLVRRRTFRPLSPCAALTLSLATLWDISIVVGEVTRPITAVTILGKDACDSASPSCTFSLADSTPLLFDVAIPRHSSC
jgi:hypothetical protein